MAAIESSSENSPRNDNNGPPALSITIPKISELKITTKPWENVQLPIDIMLLAVKHCEFLSCYCYLSDVFKSYTRALGFVFFGHIGKDEGNKLKVALFTCSEGGGEPGGAVIAVSKGVEILKPKAVFCVGSCGALHREKTKLGDVVISAKLITYAQRKVTENGVEPRGFMTPVSRDISRLILQAGFGWQAPLKNPEVREVKVLCSGEFLSGPEQVESAWRRDELVRLYPNAIAVEMDGDGVFAAAHDLKTEWVVIKGISHYADCSASLTEEWIPFASAMAASVMNNILSEPIVFEEWPHYQSSSNGTRIQSGGSIGLPLIRNGNGNELLGSLLQTFVGNCASGQMNYKGRVINYSAKGRVHSWRDLWVYDATARDVQSGISAEVRHYDTSQEAIHHAVQKLKDKLRDEGFVTE